MTEIDYLASILERLDSICQYLHQPYVPTSASPEMWHGEPLKLLADLPAPVSSSVTIASTEKGYDDFELREVTTEIAPSLEHQIRAYLMDHPAAKGKEIIEATGGKQATVYSILRRIKLEKQIIEETVNPDTPKNFITPLTEGDYDFTELLRHAETRGES